MVYPIKSCGGVGLERSDLQAAGLEHDRRWMLLDDKGRMATQRRFSSMAQIRVAIEPDTLLVTAPGMPDLALPLPDERGQEALAVPTWHGRTWGVAVGEHADRWFGRYLGTSCRLLRMPDAAHRLPDSSFAAKNDRVSFADAFPLSLLNEASLADLNTRLRKKIPIERFRPNLVVDGLEPFEEDGWEKIKVGYASFRVAEPCPRCSVIAVDQGTGERTGTEPLRALAGYRWGESGLLFGANLIPDNSAALLRGSNVTTFPRPR